MERIDEEFRALQACFLQTTSCRVDEMLRDLERLEEPAAERKPAGSELFRHAHALAGLGSSYGFPEISRIGESGERIADELTKQEPTSRADVLFQLRLIVESLRDALQRTQLPA